VSVCPHSTPCTPSTLRFLFFQSMSERGYVKRMSPDAFTAQRKGGTGRSGPPPRSDDVPVRRCSVDSILFFSDGTAYNIKACAVPRLKGPAHGPAGFHLLPLAEDERITSMLPVPSFQNPTVSVMLTKQGNVKQTALDALLRGPQERDCGYPAGRRPRTTQRTVQDSTVQYSTTVVQYSTV